MPATDYAISLIKEKLKQEKFRLEKLEGIFDQFAEDLVWYYKDPVTGLEMILDLPSISKVAPEFIIDFTVIAKSRAAASDDDAESEMPLSLDDIACAEFKRVSISELPLYISWQGKSPRFEELLKGIS